MKKVLFIIAIISFGCSEPKNDYLEAVKYKLTHDSIEKYKVEEQEKAAMDILFNAAPQSLVQESDTIKM